MRKSESKPVGVRFRLRLLALEFAATLPGDFRLIIRRRDKSFNTNGFTIQPEKHCSFATGKTRFQFKDIVLEFPTMMDHCQQTHTYKSKSATIQVQFKSKRNSGSSAENPVQLNSVQLDLAKYIMLRTDCLTIPGDITGMRLSYEGSSDVVQDTALGLCTSGIKLQPFKSSYSLAAPRDAPRESPQSQAPRKLINRNKQKTLTIIPFDTANDDAKSAKVVNKPSQKGMGSLHIKKAMSSYNKSPSRGDRCDSVSAGRESLEELVPSPTYNNILAKPKRGVKINEDYNTHHRLQRNTSSPHSSQSCITQNKSNNPNKSKFVGDSFLLNQLKEQNLQLRLQLKILEEAVQHGGKEDSDKEDSGKDIIIKRLKQQIETKNKHVRQLSQEIQELRSQKSHYLDSISELQKQMTELKFEKQKLVIEHSYAFSSNLSRISIPPSDSCSSSVEVKKLKEIYEAEIEELREQLRQKTRILTEVPSDIKQDQKQGKCINRECDQEKRKNKIEIKGLNKKIGELESTLKTKQKLIQSYKGLQEDRQKENSKQNINRQYEKWKAEKLLLEQQILDLKASKANNMAGAGLGGMMGMGRGQQNKIEQDLVICRNDKENLEQELRKVQKSLVDLQKARDEAEARNLEEVLRLKSESMRLLNAVIQFGGWPMLDKISNEMLA